MGRPAAVLLLFELLLAAAPARAHMGSTKTLLVEPQPSGAHVVAELDPVDCAYALGLAAPDAPELEALVDEGDRLRTWLAASVHVTGRGGECSARVGSPDIVQRDDGPRIRLEVDFTCPEPIEALRLRDDAIFDDDPQHEALVRMGSGEGQSALVLRATSREVAIGRPPSVLATLQRFVVEGALHLITGYDHLFFLLSLLLVAGGVAARNGLKRAIKDVSLVVTGFTVGHSVTLIAATLDVVTLPSRLVESAIALSIVIVALWNYRQPEQHRGLPWVAVAFGLIHGFGFSSVLRELVLPRGEQVLALLAFNVGIELAQLACVLVLIGPLAWAGKKPWYTRWVVQWGSLGIALIATVWLFQRALGF